MKRFLASPGSVRVRVLLACGILAAPATLGTMARWHDSGTAQSDALAAGTLDLQVDGELAGPGGAVTRDWSAADLVPGEFHAFGVAVGNGGDAGFTYRLDVTGEGWSYTNGAVVVQPYAGTPTAAGTCTGGTLGANRTIPSADPFFDGRELAPGGSEPVCIRIGLVATAPPTNQGASGSLRFVFTATQQDPNP